MKHLITLTFQYYRLLLFNNVMFSLMIGTALILFSDGYVITALILAKLIGFFSASGHYYYMHSNSYYYYRNAGISIRRLFTYSFAIDMGALIIILSIYKFAAICLN